MPPDLRQRYIAEAAYYIAENEGFPPGRELEHWLRAEACIERSLGTLAQVTEASRDASS